MSQKYEGEIDVGLLTVPFGRTPFNEIAAWAGKEGFKRLSIAAWPPPEESASGRSGEDAFVAPHCGNLSTFDKTRASEMTGAMQGAGVKPPISLAYYENTSTADGAKRQEILANYRLVCRAAQMLGAEYVGTFPGRNELLSVDESTAFFLKKVGPELVRIANGEGVKSGFENCPMEGWIPDKAIGNIASYPENWERIFGELDMYMCLDPSHMVWQGIDPENALEDFASRVLEIHAKDAKILDPRFRPAETRDAKPLPYNPANYKKGIVGDDWSVKNWGAGLYHHAVPGLGSVDWKGFIRKMREIGLNVPVVLEIEDEAFNPRSTGPDNYGRAAFRVGMRTLKPYCAPLG